MPEQQAPPIRPRYELVAGWDRDRWPKKLHWDWERRVPDAERRAYEAEKRARRLDAWLWAVAALCVAGWFIVALLAAGIRAG